MQNNRRIPHVIALATLVMAATTVGIQLVSASELSLTKATAGLNFAATAAATNAHENIISFPVDCSWIGKGSTPVTYSMTVGGYTSVPNFSTHIFLVPGDGTGAEPDFTEPNVVYIDLRNGANGNGTMTYRFKTNSPNSNGGFFGPNNPASITGPSILGTWRVTFLNDTNVTMTAPNGASTNFNLRQSDVSAFADPMEVYYGIVPNSTNGVGQRITLTSVLITNTVPSNGDGIYDNFVGDTDLDPNLWIRATDDSVPTRAVSLTGTDAKYWVSWTLPANGLVLQTNAVLSAPGAWATNSAYVPIAYPNSFQVLVSTTNLPAGGAGSEYFRLSTQ
jgi:hypothetical protein